MYTEIDHNAGIIGLTSKASVGPATGITAQGDSDVLDRLLLRLQEQAKQDYIAILYARVAQRLVKILREPASLDTSTIQDEFVCAHEELD